MRILLGLLLLAGCPGSPKSLEPHKPSIVSMPALAPTPWWVSPGDAACPPIQAIVPGGAPGATVQDGHVRRTPTDIHCEAGGGAHGPATRIYADGRPAENGMVDRGIRVGAWTEYHPNGNVASFGTYAGGEPVGVWTWQYESGHERERGELRGARRIGLWMAWDDAGDPGPDRFVEYNGDGKQIMRGVYRDGRAIETLPVCIVGMAYPGCRFLPIVDLGVREAPSESQPSDGKKGSATFELGGLVNLDDHNGVGLTAGWVIDATYPTFSVGARYRYWVYDWIALEAGAARLFARSGRDDAGFAAHVAAVGADIVSLTATLETHGSEVAGLFGVRLGLPTLLGALAIFSKK
jgi:hypothetical protein